MDGIGMIAPSALKDSALGEAAQTLEDAVGRELVNIAHGRFERMLSGLTAVAAAVTTTEIYAEHYKASFGNKWMWSPILVTPPVLIAGVAGMFSKRWAKTALPIAAAIYAADGLAGEFFHMRGVSRKPGGWKLVSYNVPMGPPIAAPGLMALVGGMGLVAAALRREKSVLPVSEPSRSRLRAPRTWLSGATAGGSRKAVHHG